MKKPGKPKRKSGAKIIAEADLIVDKIKPLLAGQDYEVQSAVLGELVSLFMAGHHPSIRETVWETFQDMVSSLTAVNENILGTTADEWPSQH